MWNCLPGTEQLHRQNPLKENLQESGNTLNLSVEKGPCQASIANSIKYSDVYVSFCLSNKNKVISFVMVIHVVSFPMDLEGKDKIFWFYAVQIFGCPTWRTWEFQKCWEFGFSGGIKSIYKWVGTGPRMSQKTTQNRSPPAAWMLQWVILDQRTS